MVILKTRGQIVMPTETVQIQAQFRGFDGYAKDLSVFPDVSIIEPSGNVILGPTKMGVFRLATGLYGFDYAVGINASIGVYTDVWQGIIDGYVTTGTFNFVVHNTQMPMVNSDGYAHLGDDPGFNFSQTAIKNINKLLKALKARLNSAGKAKTKDQFGNDIFIDCDIYSLDTLVTFLCNALTDFNQIPHFTFFTFDDTPIIEQFFEAILQGAVIYALASKALIERGREFSVSDNGISFVPPTVSELLNTQWNTELTNHFDKLKLIKASMKPAPSSLGVFSTSTGANSAVRRLRFLRQKQWF